MDRLRLSYAEAKELNPSLIYGSISGYGPDRPWAQFPGQDLLAQARSGVMWLSGNADAGPVPIGIPVADIMAGAHLAHGLLAALYRRERHGIGAHVETSLLEAMVDLQFEFLTTFLNNQRQPPRRLPSGSAHGYQPAPYGLYEARDGHVAIAVADLEALANSLELKRLSTMLKTASDPGFSLREEIREVLAVRIYEEDSDAILGKLTDHGIWCAPVLSWDDLLATATFKSLDIVSTGHDLGLAMLRRSNNAYDLFARVSTLVPGHACLLCGSYIDPRRARDEALRRDDHDAYQRLKNEAYVLGEGDPSPAVVTFTTEAATMAVNEWLAGVTGLAGEAGMLPTRIRRFHARDERWSLIEPRPDCPCCNQAETLGRADVKPFLDIVS